MPSRIFTSGEIYDLYLKHRVITIDSRNVPQDAIFFALKGDHFDGNQYAADAIRAGAALAIADDPDVCTTDKICLVKDVLATLQEIASIHRNRLKFPVIGITGSNGKTTTKELIYSVLSKKFKTIATLGNLNNHIGVPLTLLRADEETEMLIVEMGANHRGEIAHLSRMAEPTHAIITNIGIAHLEGFGSPEGVKLAKKELYDYLGTTGQGTIIWNRDDDIIANLVENYTTGKFSYGSKPGSDVKGAMFSEQPELYLNVKWDAQDGIRLVKTRLVGGYNFSNVLAAIAIGVLLDVGSDDIVSAIELYQPANSRSEFRETGKNRIVVDCYNANPSSMVVAIENFNRISRGDRLLILGDMFELGDYAEGEHRKILDYIRPLGIETILVGEVFSRIAPGSGIRAYRNAEDAMPELQSRPVLGREILIKGSRGVQLEKLLEYL
ncbi:MAG: UDP-N-acetylmuramoyl-tripeptide--D-alanyl-D-alanine ligase [Bacteroidales bacterium]